MITYDTTINYICLPGYAGCKIAGVQQMWQLRITRPRNYFTPGNADTASRPLIINMEGEGQTGTDTNYLTVYGPHFYLANGWNGAVQLDNGTHYPLIITIMPDSPFVPPNFIQPLLDTLFKYFHPRKNSIHLMGFSGGVQSLGGYLWFQATPGDEHNMANIRSFVDLQGLDPSTNYGVSPVPYPNYWGYWAHKYGGRFWGLEGNNDDRFIWQISENMNDSVSSSAYFTYEDDYNGEHCCWNDFYYPEEQNWTDTVPYGNHYLTSETGHANTMGTYLHDPKWGASIYQWALRQGDTTLIAFGSPYFVANAGANRVIYLPQDTIHLTGSGVDSSATIMSYVWTLISGSGATIVSPDSTATAITGLTPGTYTLQLTLTDSRSRTAVSKVTVRVLPQISNYFVANAGPDRVIYSPQDSVHLISSGVDSAATITSYAWTMVSGTGATIVSPASANTAITGLTPGSYIFQVTLTDNLNRTASDTVSVQVDDTTVSPYFVASAGPNMVIYSPQNSIQVTGTGVDSAATITSYAWTTVSGTGATIVSPSSPSTAVTGLTPGSYIFQLTLTDSRNRTAISTLSVQVDDTTVSPYFVANAGPSRVIYSPQDSIQVTGSGADSAATITSYAWTMVSGTGAVIVSPSSASTAIDALTPGSYTFQLTLTDSRNRTAVSTLSVQVDDTTVSPYFVANAGPSRVIYAPQNSIQVTGSGIDSSAMIISYAWTEIAGAGSIIVSPSSAVTTITGLTPGSYTFQLALTDSRNRTATDTMSVRVDDTTIDPYFTADAGPNRTIYAPQDSIQVTGSGVDSAATITSYAWSMVSGSGAVIVSPTSISTAIDNLTKGAYTFQLTLTDSLGRVATSTMSVVVNDTIGVTTTTTPPPSDTAISLVIYPNPFLTNEFTIVFSDSLTGAVNINLIGERGNLLRSYQCQKQDQYFSQQLDISGLGKGIYFVQVTMHGYRAMKKVMKL